MLCARSQSSLRSPGRNLESGFFVSSHWLYWETIPPVLLAKGWFRHTQLLTRIKENECGQADMSKMLRKEMLDYNQVLQPRRSKCCLQNMQVVMQAECGHENHLRSSAFEF